MNSEASFYVQAALWSQIAAAVLFLCVLIWLWVRFIQPAILAAQDRHNRQIAEAERHRDEAKAMLDVLRNETSGATRDGELIRERAVAQAEREHDAAMAETRQAGERALVNAKGELARARAAACDQLRYELLEQALERARVEAGERVDPATNARLVDLFLASLERRRTGAEVTHG